MATVSLKTLGADILSNATAVAAAVTATQAQVTALADLLIILGDRHGNELAGPMKLLNATDKANLSLI